MTVEARAGVGCCGHGAIETNINLERCFFCRNKDTHTLRTHRVFKRILYIREQKRHLHHAWERRLNPRDDRVYGGRDGRTSIERAVTACATTGHAASEIASIIEERTR